jgi:activator of HSP90 ATPase
MPDGFDRYARFGRCARPRRNDDAAGLQQFDLVDRNLIVAKYPNVFTQFPEILHKVIGKGIKVVDHQEHGNRPKV